MGNLVEQMPKMLMGKELEETVFNAFLLIRNSLIILHNGARKTRTDNLYCQPVILPFWKFIPIRNNKSRIL